MSLSQRRHAKRRGVTPQGFPLVTIDASSVAAVVTCHNYERYLPECLDSLLSQTARFSEIVVVDDASDNGPEVQRICEQCGVRYERVEYRDACLSRDHGASQTTAFFLCFVDADNYLGTGFVASLLPPLVGDRKVALSYAPAFQVDAGGHVTGRYTPVKYATYDELSRENAIDTCCLVRRDAYLQAGKWEPGAYKRYRFHDWNLWLRVLQDGWEYRYVDQCCWYYRRHNSSMSAELRSTDHQGRVQLMEDQYHVAVVTAFCGRRWALERTLEAYTKLGWDPARLHLVANDNSLDEKWGTKLRRDILKVCRNWGSVQFLQDNVRAVQGMMNDNLANNTQPRLDYMRELNDAISRIYARNVRQYLGPKIRLVFTLEDDIELLQSDTLPKLLSAMDTTTMAVGGVVNVRFTDKTPAGPIAFAVEREVPYTAKRLPRFDNKEDAVQVDGIAYGCTLWRAEAWHRFMPCRLSPNDDFRPPWQDVTFSAEIRRAGFKIMLHRGVRTRHWRENGTWE